MSMARSLESIRRSEGNIPSSGFLAEFGGNDYFGTLNINTLAYEKNVLSLNDGASVSPHSSMRFISKAFGRGSVR